MTLTIPTMLTLFRILLIPVLVVVFYLPHGWTNIAAAAIFIVGALTDWLDGWIARRYGMYSAFGAFLDPVADKLTVAFALLLVVERHDTPWMALLSAVIIGREITISALREWMAQTGKRGSVAVATIGKLKTTAQMAAILCLLVGLRDFYGHDLIFIGNILMFIAAVLTLWSMFYYLKMAWKEFQ